MLTAIAIDDEPIALNIIRGFAADIEFLRLQATFTNAFEARAYLQQQPVHLIFLDIKMPDITGIEFIQSIPLPPMVIFTTAYSEHAVQSFELDAIDYLLKPFSEERFKKACEKAERLHALSGANSKAEENELFLKTGTERIRVATNEILYLESYGNYIRFVLAGKKIISRLTMAEAQALLPNDRFLRIHRSFIVNKMHVRATDKTSVWINETQLPVGPNFSAAVNKISLGPA
jgi:DNA-binding LytR/AlgR family response regulator